MPSSSLWSVWSCKDSCPYPRQNPCFSPSQSLFTWGAVLKTNSPGLSSCCVSGWKKIGRYSFQSSDVVQLDGRVYFHFTNKEIYVFDFHFILSHETEGIFTSDQSHFDVYSVQHQAMLVTQVEVRSADHDYLLAGQAPLCWLLKPLFNWWSSMCLAVSLYHMAAVK